MAATATTTGRLGIDNFQQDLGISRADLADALGVSVDELARWDRGEVVSTPEASRRLDQLAALYAHIFETFKSEGVREWLNTPNRYIGSITKEATTPFEALRRGEFEWVEGALVVIDDGIFV